MRLHLAISPNVRSFALQLSRDLWIWIAIDPGGMYLPPGQHNCCQNALTGTLLTSWYLAAGTVTDADYMLMVTWHQSSVQSLC